MKYNTRHEYQILFSKPEYCIRVLYLVCFIEVSSTVPVENSIRRESGWCKS